MKPDLKVLDVNQKGVLYATHLAMHYCRYEGVGGVRGDKSLVIVTNLAGYMDQPGRLQYDVSRCSGRAVMKVLRQGAWGSGVWVNCLAPW
jgi:NAD(P)-dependent dehydrogenase (short-subunit alcohol dehydrogenase family)